MLYDNVRGEGHHDLNNCKHLACSEVRASLFNDQCKVKQDFVELFRGSYEGEKLDAQKYCFKNLAITHLREKQRCNDKAEQYVDFVFEQCLQDRSPFAGKGGKSSPRLSGITEKII